MDGQTPKMDFSGLLRRLCGRLEEFEKDYASCKNDNSRLREENQRLASENETLRARFRLMLTVESFRALLQPGHSETDLAELCRRVEISPDQRSILIALFNDAVLSRKDRVPYSPFADPELHGRIGAIQSVIARRFPVRIFPDGDRLLAIVAIGPEQSAQPVREDIEAMGRQIRRELGLPIYLAVSTLIPDCSGLPDAYAAILQMIGYKTIMEDLTEDTLFAGDMQLPYNQEKENALVSKEQHQFVFYVRVGMLQEARASVRALCRARLVAGANVTTLAIAMASLKDVFIHALQSACMDFGILDAFLEIDGPNRIAGAVSAQELMEQLDQILVSLNDSFSALSPVYALPQRILAYVDEHYQEPDLNVNSVADFFSISASYATRVFQKAHGQTILGYIHRRRIQAAKELLGSGLSIAQIAEQTGYGSSVNMIRSFKRYEGKTPGQMTPARPGAEEV